MAHTGRPYSSSHQNAITPGPAWARVLPGRLGRAGPGRLRRTGRAGWATPAPGRVTLGDVDGGTGDGPEQAPRIRRRDRHGRGLRGVLAPAGVPLHRSRAQRFDELVLQAVARLEPRWEAHLADVEFAVEEIPPLAELGPGPVPLARLEAGLAGAPAAPGPGDGPVPGPRPARIVVYRRPLMARAEGDEELGELIFEVVVEEFARLLGLDPEDVDPGYPADD
jgi:predicted Zn-dependent protease with MMP-like domain